MATTYGTVNYRHHLAATDGVSIHRVVNVGDDYLEVDVLDEPDATTIIPFQRLRRVIIRTINEHKAGIGLEG